MGGFYNPHADGGTLTIQDEGVTLGVVSIINFTGNGVIGSILGGTVTENIPGGSAGSFTVETPSGTVNGINKAFTVSNTPVFVTVDGIIMTGSGDGYTYSAGTITFNDAPPVHVDGSLAIIRSYHN